jgi:hypothetical protein
MRSRTLEVLPVRNGRGLVARRTFARGACITRLQGRGGHSDVLWKGCKRAARRAANCIRFDAERYLNPEGELGAFSNHSCKPNAALFKERGRLVLRAIRAIRAGDEVTHDYSTLLGADDVWTMRCNCGERGCRGTVRRFDALPAAALRRYRALGAIPAFILRTR